jgi:hypothetical protein
MHRELLFTMIPQAKATAIWNDLQVIIIIDNRKPILNWLFALPKDSVFNISNILSLFVKKKEAKLMALKKHRNFEL